MFAEWQLTARARGLARYLSDFGRRLNNSGSGLKYLTPVLCYFFGALSLLLVVSPGDGTWQLYAREMLNGKRIYTDLGLNQQPIFPIISALSIMISPTWIIGQRAIFFVELAVYVFLIYKISRLGSKKWHEIVLLQLGFFFIAIHFEGFRFDDYHALVHVGVLASIYVSAVFLSGAWSISSFAVVQAVITAFVLLTRINEGLALLGSLFFVVLEREGLSRPFLRAAGIGLVTATPCFLGTIWLVGETPYRWMTSTLVEASQAKGGVSLFHYPWMLFRESIEFITAPFSLAYLRLLTPFLAWFAAVLLIRRTQPLWADILLIASAAYFILFLRAAYRHDIILAVTPFVILFTATASLYAIGRVVRRSSTSTNGDFTRSTLVFYPLLLFVFGSLSSGGAHYALYFPTATALLIVPLITYRDERILDRSKGVKIGFYLLCAAFAFSGLMYRWDNPYSWLSFRVNPYFRDYILVRDKSHGPHFMTKDVASLIKPVCGRVHREDSLLSLPFSFANYYCGIPPWKGYVQTFFDISTAGRIDELIKDLERAPPRYVFYQRQIPTLRAHETAFNGGMPLPHRKLDSLILQKLVRAEWHVVYRSELFPPSTWMLIRTDADHRSSTRSEEQ